MGGHGTAPAAIRPAHRTGIGVGDSRQREPLVVVHTVSSLQIGGMEQVVLRLAAAQKAAGHRVAVLALRGGPLEKELRDRGVPVTVLGSGTIARGARTLRYFLSGQYRVVHAHNPTSLHYAVLSKAVSRAALIVTIHGDQETHARLGSALEWKLADSIVVVSHAARRGLRLPGSDNKVTVIHNGIAPVDRRPEDREARRAELGASKGTFVGAIVARIDGRKGHTTLLRSARILKDAGMSLLLLVIGDGAERAKVEQLAAELGLDARTVRFLGSRTDVNQLLNGADFFVLPSDTEGLPLSVLEAMAHGLPIVASCVGGIPELLDDGREGLLVAPGDADGLARAIRSLAENPVLCTTLGRAARARADGEFSLRTTVDNYDRVYRQALFPQTT